MKQRSFEACKLAFRWGWMQVVPEDELSLQLSDSFLLGMLRQSQPPSVSLWQCNYLRAPPALSHICIYLYFYRWSVASVSAPNYIVVILFFLFIEPSPSQELTHIAYDQRNICLTNTDWSQIWEGLAPWCCFYLCCWSFLPWAGLNTFDRRAAATIAFSIQSAW